MSQRAERLFWGDIGGRGHYVMRVAAPTALPTFKPLYKPAKIYVTAVALARFSSTRTVTTLGP